MKTKILFIFLIAFLSGCSGVKKTTTSEVQSDTKTNTEVSAITELKQSGKNVEKSTAVTDSSVQKYLAQIEKLTALYEARLRTYDTSKPTNPTTGTPPILSDLTITNKTDNSKETKHVQTSQSNKTLNTDIDSNYKTDLRQRIDSLKNINSKLISATKTKEVPKSRWWLWLLIGAAIPVIIWIALKSSWPAKVFALMLNVFKKI